MQKIIIDRKVIVYLSNGNTIVSDNLSPEIVEKVRNTDNEEEIISLLIPEYKKIVEERNDALARVNEASNSGVLTLRNGSLCWDDVSSLSVPIELVDDILEAEKNNDSIKLETYKNFWTLMSLNTDEKCRENLYWFLQRNGLVLERSGFFIAYRNVIDTNKQDENGNHIYTDDKTRTFKITIGNMVTMNREDCDPDSDVLCSSGLHLGSSDWLRVNYCGDTGIVCLCNPADVVAVPKEEWYGKLRTCAYLPIGLAEYDSNGFVIPSKELTGFKCSYVTKVIYEGIMGTEKDSNYKIHIPELPVMERKVIYDNLMDIAMKSITERIVE